MPLSESDLISSLDEEVRRRQYRPRDPRRMADVVSQLFARRGYARIQGSKEYEQTWQEVVSKSISQQTKVGNLRGGVLEVMVSNSAVVQELSFQKYEIITRLNDGLAKQSVRDLRFRVGKIGD